MSIADKITRLETAKEEIATAIENKGGTVSAEDGFEEFSADITSISIPSYSINTELTVVEGALTAAITSVSGAVVVTISDDVASISNDVFKNNALITRVNIPVECTTFGTDVFTGCTSLTDIYYTGTQAEWEAITGLSGAGIDQSVTIHYEYTPE